MLPSLKYSQLGWGLYLSHEKCPMIFYLAVSAQTLNSLFVTCKLETIIIMKKRKWAWRWSLKSCPIPSTWLLVLKDDGSSNGNWYETRPCFPERNLASGSKRDILIQINFLYTPDSSRSILTASVLKTAPIFGLKNPRQSYPAVGLLSLCVSHNSGLWSWHWKRFNVVHVML